MSHPRPHVFYSKIILAFAVASVISGWVLGDDSGGSRFDPNEWPPHKTKVVEWAESIPKDSTVTIGPADASKPDEINYIKMVNGTLTIEGSVTSELPSGNKQQTEVHMIDSAVGMNNKVINKGVLSSARDKNGNAAEVIMALTKYGDTISNQGTVSVQGVERRTAPRAFQSVNKDAAAANEIDGTIDVLGSPASGFFIINGLGTNSGTLNVSGQSSGDQPSYGMKARNQNVHDFGVEQGNAEVRNRGTLNVNGKNNYGMAATIDASNPPPDGYSSTATNWANINVAGDGSVGMSTDTHRAKVDNSGNIFTKDNAIGIKISGNGQLVNAGTVRGTGTGLLYSGNFPRGHSIKPGYVIEGAPAIKMEQAGQSPLHMYGGYVTGNIESVGGKNNALYIAPPLEEVSGKNTTVSIKGNISGFSTINISGTDWNLNGWISGATRFDTSSQISRLFVSDTIASSFEPPETTLRFATTSDSINKLDINTEGGGKIETLSLSGSAQLNHLPELRHIAVYHSGNWSVSPVAPLPDLLTITAGSGGQIEEITTKPPSNKPKSLYLSFSQSTLVAGDLVVHSLPESIIKTIDLSSKDDRKPLLLFLEGGETGTIKGRSDLNDKFVLNKGSVTAAVNDISTITVTSDNADAWSVTGSVYNPNSININDGAQINSINTHSSHGSDHGALSLAFNSNYTKNDFIKVDNQGELGSLDFSSDAERPRLRFLQQGQTAVIKGRSDKQDELELKTGSVKGTVDNIHTVRVTGGEWTVLNWLTGTQKVDLQSPVHQIRISDKKEQGTMPGSTLGLVNSKSPISITSHADQQMDLWLRGKAQISDLQGARNILLDTADAWSVTGSVPNLKSITITPHAKVSSINTRSSHGDKTLTLTFNGTHTDDNFFKVDNRGTLQRLDFSNGAKRPPLQLSLKGVEMGAIEGHPDRDDQLILNTGLVTGEVNNIRTINVTGKAWTFLNWAVGTRQVILESPIHQIRVSDKKQHKAVPGATLNLITSDSPVIISSHADQQADLWLRGKAKISHLEGVRNILLDSAEDWSVNGSVYNPNAITISPEAQVSSINTHSTHLNRGSSDKTLNLSFNGTYTDDNVFKVDNSGTLGSLDFSSNANRPPLQFSLIGGEVKEIKGRSDKNDELILDKGLVAEAVNDIHTIRVTGREWTFLNWATGTQNVDLHSPIQQIRVSGQREQADEEGKKGLPAATLGILTHSNPVSITSHAGKQTDLWLQGVARITDLEGALGIRLDSAKDWSVTGKVLNPGSITIKPGAQVRNISTHSESGTQSLALVFDSNDADDFKVDNYGTLESLDFSGDAHRPSLKLSQKGGEIVKEIKGRSDKKDELVLDTGSVKGAVDSIHTIRVTGKQWDFLNWATDTRQVTLESSIHQIRVFDKKDTKTVPEETLCIISDENHPVMITSHADKQADLWLKGEVRISQLQGARNILLDSADAWSVSGQVNNPNSIIINPGAKVSSISTGSTHDHKSLALAFNDTRSNDVFFKVDNHGTLASLDFSSDAQRPSLQFVQSSGNADLVKARPGMNDTLIMVSGILREQSGFDNLILQGDKWGFLRMENLDTVNLVKGGVVARISDDTKDKKGTARLLLDFTKSFLKRSAFAINNEGGKIYEIDFSRPDSARPQLSLNHVNGITGNIKGQPGYGDNLFLNGGKITQSVSGIDNVWITGKQWETIAIQNPLSITVTENGTARLITTRAIDPAGAALKLPLKFIKSAVPFKKLPLNTRGTIGEIKFDDSVSTKRPPINIIQEGGTISGILSLPGKGDSLDVQNGIVEGNIIGLDTLTFSGPEAQFGGQLIETMGTVSISGKLTLTSNLKLSVTPVKYLQLASEAGSDTSTASTTVHINKGGSLYAKAPSAAPSSRRDSALEVAGLYKQEGTLVVTLDELRDLKAPYIKATRIEVGPEADVLLNNQSDIGDSGEYLLMQSSDCDIKTMPSLVTTSFTPHTLYYLRLTARQLFLVSHHVATFVGDLARSGGANDSALKAIEIALTTRQSNDSDPLNSWIQSQIKRINNNPAEFAKIVNQMTPDLSGASISSATAAIRQARTAVGARQTGLRDGIAAGDMVASGNVWMQYANTDAAQDKKDGYNGYQAKTHGFTMGVDSDLNERMTLGVAYTYSKGDVNGTDGSSSRIDTEGHTFSVYSSFGQGSVLVDGRIGYSWSNNDGKRNVVGNEIKARHDVNSWDVGLLTGYKMPLGQSGEWHWLPQLAFNYASIKPDDYREAGVNGWSDILRFARVKSDTYEILELGAGLKLSSDITTASMTVKPEVSLMAFHDFKDDPVTMTAQFAQGGNAFLMSGAKREQSRYQFDAVINMESHRNLAFAISYHYDWMDSSRAYGFIARVSYGF